MYSALYAPPDFTVVRAMADTLRMNGLYEKAVQQYTKAVALKKDVRCLLDRGTCHMKLGNTMNAWSDAEMAMYLDRNNYRVFLLKAEALFYSGDFEVALIFYHRGKRMRPDVQQFSVGIANATQAIINCVGTPERIKLTLKGDLSYFYDKLNPIRALRKIMGIMAGSCINLLAVQSTHQSKKSSSLVINKDADHQKTVHELLGQMYNDRKYLEKIFVATDDSTPSDANIHNMSEMALEFLNKRADFWRNQRPMYSRLYDQKMFAMRFGHHEEAHDADILENMELIETDMDQLNYQGILVTAQGCLKMLKQYPNLPNKPALQGQLHSSLGTAFLELGQHADALMHHEKDLALAHKHEIAEGLARATDNIGRVYFELGDYKQAIELWQRRLSQVNSETEGLWLSQQLSKSYLKIDKPSKALKYAQASTNPSGMDDVRWAMQGNILAGQCQLRLGDLGESLDHFTVALDIAQQIKDRNSKEALNDIVAAISKRIRWMSNPFYTASRQDNGDRGKDEEPESRKVSKAFVKNLTLIEPKVAGNKTNQKAHQ